MLRRDAITDPRPIRRERGLLSFPLLSSTIRSRLAHPLVYRHARRGKPPSNTTPPARIARLSDAAESLRKKKRFPFLHPALRLDAFLGATPIDQARTPQLDRTSLVLSLRRRKQWNHRRGLLKATGNRGIKLRRDRHIAFDSETAIHLRAPIRALNVSITYTSHTFHLSSGLLHSKSLSLG